MGVADVTLDVLVDLHGAKVSIDSQSVNTYGVAMEEPATDGRTLRSRRSRLAVIEAIIKRGTLSLAIGECDAHVLDADVAVLSLEPQFRESSLASANGEGHGVA